MGRRPPTAYPDGDLSVATTPQQTRETCAGALRRAGFDVVDDRRLLHATRDGIRIEIAAAAARAPRTGVEGYPPLWKRSAHQPRRVLWFAAVLDTAHDHQVFVVPSLRWTRDQPGPFVTTSIDFTIHMSGRTVPDDVRSWTLDRAARRIDLAAAAGAVVQRELLARNLPRTTPDEAAEWLDDAGVLARQKRTPGLPLRSLLRDAFEIVPGATRDGHRWFLERTDSEPPGATTPRRYRRANDQVTIATGAAPAVPDPDAYGRGVRVHARLQNLVADELQRLGQAPYSPGPHDPVEWDLRWDTPDAIWICEVKSITPGNAESQTRAGMAQLLWYSHAIRHAGERRPTRMLLMLEYAPRDPRWPPLLAEQQILIAWPETLRSVLEGL